MWWLFCWMSQLLMVSVMYRDIDKDVINMEAA